MGDDANDDRLSSGLRAPVELRGLSYAVPGGGGRRWRERAPYIAGRKSGRDD